MPPMVLACGRHVIPMRLGWMSVRIAADLGARAGRCQIGVEPVPQQVHFTAGPQLAQADCVVTLKISNLLLGQAIL